MKTTTRILSLSVFIFVGCIILVSLLPSCGTIWDDSNGVNQEVGMMHTYETDDTTFYNGEVLQPDKYHSVPLIITNAAALNELMVDYNPECIGDVQDILRVTTDTLKTK